jgi:formylglycine-generating enzyme required for sulfatase activity/V8-like Glu-specific endopeptidase
MERNIDALEQFCYNISILSDIIFLSRGKRTKMSPDETYDRKQEKLVHPYQYIPQGFMDPPPDYAIRSVCRVEAAKHGNTLGTGFLIAPRLILTNFHVLNAVKNISGVERQATKLEFRFGYKKFPSIQPGRLYKAKDAGALVAYSDDQKLDYALICLAEPPYDDDGMPIQPLLTSSNARNLVLDEQVAIIQHPEGDTIKVAYGQVVNIEGERFQYNVNTKGGSSGSPVFDAQWDLVGLHRGSGPDREDVNEGIVLAAILVEIKEFLEDAWREYDKDRSAQPLLSITNNRTNLPGIKSRAEMPEVLQSLLSEIIKKGTAVIPTSKQVAELKSHRLTNMVKYRLERVIMNRNVDLNEHFVNLSLLIDQGKDAPDERWQPEPKIFNDLRTVLTDTLDPALVLLGPPGCGKSTIMHRFELDMSINALRGESDIVTFFVQLNYFQPTWSGDKALVREWLNERWRNRYPGLPDLDKLLDEGRVVLLLDGLNEMPKSNTHSYLEQIMAWRQFLDESIYEKSGNRAIFSCRSLDYSFQLSTETLPVPQVRIEPLSNDQIRQFLEVYTPEHAGTLWTELVNSPQMEMLRTPFFLKLLIAQLNVNAQIPKGSVGLFTSFVRQALKREINQDNPLFRPNGILTQRDYERLVQVQDWSKTPFALPERGVLVKNLSMLAFVMQQKRKELDMSHVRIGYEEALTLLNDKHSEDIIRAGVALGVLEDDQERDEVLFAHQLLQEYFAARKLAIEPNPDLVRIAWRADAVTPTLAETLASLGKADPLPPPTTTGWEETTVLALPMGKDQNSIVRNIAKINLPLAARCAIQVEAVVSEDVKNELRWALVERTQDDTADLRARIAAGIALGNLGDPRFQRHKGTDGEYLAPPLVKIQGGAYPIGSDGQYDPDEAPIHTVTILPFWMGKFPVTNAEWKCFMDCHGYDDERWWDTEGARAWFRGEITMEGPKSRVRFLREMITLEDMIKAAEEGKVSKKQFNEWKDPWLLSKEEFEVYLDEKYPAGRLTQPEYWLDEAYNSPAQPVVGICWYEMCAYCKWLSAQTGQNFRLPSEVEWEAAARGLEGRIYAYGIEFNANACNVFETHVRRLTPIGVFPSGTTTEGLVDMTGNIYEKTSSLYGRYLTQPEFAYPYRHDDGRENLEAPFDVYRIMKGGAWRNTYIDGRAAKRVPSHPTIRAEVNGFRLVCSSPTF